MDNEERVFIVRVRIDRSHVESAPVRGVVTDVGSGESLRSTSVRDLVDFITMRVQPDEP